MGSVDSLEKIPSLSKNPMYKQPNVTMTPEHTYHANAINLICFKTSFWI
jgi:hypothetical protein